MKACCQGSSCGIRCLHWSSQHYSNSSSSSDHG